jgi:hypothetical protein
MANSVANLASADLTELVAIQQAKLGNGGFFIAIPSSSSQPSDGVTEFSRRPWLDPPLGSYAFDEQDGISLPAISATVFTVVLQFQVPNGSDGVINFVSNNFIAGGFADFSGDIIWQILLNGKPVRNFSNIRAQKGTPAQGRQVSPIRIYSNQLVQYVVRHNANVALTGGQVVCSLNGNYYPSQS